MKCPPDVAEVLAEIIYWALVRIRGYGFAGDARRCAHEADHAHNLPALIYDYSPDLLLYYFSLKEISLESAQKLYFKLDSSVKQSASAKKLVAAFKSREDNFIGKDAYEFVKSDFYNNTVRLSAFKNKNYVLLDFWASWCGPCFEVNPQIMKLFNRYASKGLVIIGISIDNKELNWRSAINRYNENKWVNILDSNKADGSLRSNFDILAIPELILIDKDGKIIGRYLGEGENSDLSDLNNELRKIFTDN